MSELISVIIPVYNSGQYLPCCVESVLNQDYKELEIIIIDDGSSDGVTGSICDSMVEKSPRIRVYHKDNGGSASARNYGIEKAKGDYIGFVDSDDRIEPNMYSSLYSDLVSHGVKVSIGNIATEEKGRSIDRLEAIPSGEYSYPELLHYFFLGHWHSACTNLYARDLFNNAHFAEREVNEDYLLNFLIFKNLNKVYYNETVFYHYIRREGSNTSSPVSLAFLDWVKHTSVILREYQYHPILKEEAEYQYLYSNIILGNKCLLTLGRGNSSDATRLYNMVTDNLKKERSRVFHNSFLSSRYRLFGVLLSCIPFLYKFIVVLIIHVFK